MTGKQQKAKAVLEDFKKRVELTQEEKSKLVDDAIIETYSQNQDFIEGIDKMSIKAFRGWYILHTFLKIIDNLVDDKAQKKLAEKVAQYQQEEDFKKRKK